MNKVPSLIKVLLIGQYPPPIGGVTTHLKRFFNRYKKSEEVSLGLLDIKKRQYYHGASQLSMWTSLRNIISPDIVHIHVASNIKIFIAMFYKMLGKKVIYTHHNIRIKNMRTFKILMLFVDKLILVNDKSISDEVKKYNYMLIPAFLPSTESTPLPDSLQNTLKKYKKIISTNSTQLLMIEGKELYGIDLCIGAFKNLVEKHKIEETLLVVVDPSGTTKEYIDELMESFQEKNNCNIYYVDENINFNELVKQSKVVLRATRSDGDSLSVREALYLGVPIIASDITYRPEGTIIFRTDDADDLENKIEEVLSVAKQQDKYINIDYAAEIVSMYKSC